MDHTYDTGDIKLDITEEQVIVQTIEDEPTTVLLQQTLSEEMGTDDVESPDDTCKVDAVPGGLGGSNNFYIKLINLVRSYPNIYDKFDASFKVPLAREKSWIEIAQSLNTSVSFAQNRWTRLRERFTREKKALDVMKKTGNINDRRRLWPYFLPMLFLSSHIKSRRTSIPGDVPADTLSGDMTVSKFFSVMGEKLKDEITCPSTSTPVENEGVEVIDKNHPDYLAWRKRKPETSNTTTPRKILAKPEGASASFMIASKMKDGENKILTKLPPGAVLLKNPPGAMGNSPVVLVPTTPTTGVTVAKTGTIPMILSTPQHAASFSQSRDLPIPNSAEHHFGMLIARELERFPKEIRAKKKQRILMVLYE